jgi:hypothetical protein
MAAVHQGSELSLYYGIDSHVRTLHISFSIWCSTQQQRRDRFGQVEIAPLYYGLNMTMYQQIEHRDMAMRSQCPRDMAMRSQCPRDRAMRSQCPRDMAMSLCRCPDIPVAVKAQTSSWRCKTGGPRCRSPVRVKVVPLLS